MALPYNVEVLEICQISAPLGSVSTTSLPLTFFDLPWLVLPPVQNIFYYEFHHPKDYFMNTILPNLKHALSLTLQHFCPLTGHFSWPQDSAKPQIVFKDGDSVPLIVAECNYDFNRLLGNHPRNANEFYPLVATYEHAKLTFPLLALQVTLFPNKGICIGITIDHAAMDGRTFHHFIKSWASICKSQGDTSFLTESLPFYDRAIVKDRNGFEIVNLNDLKMINITKETFNSIKKVPTAPFDKVRGTFVMSCSEIKQLKQWVLTHLEKDKKNVPPVHLSTFVLISAYVWICSIKARCGTESAVDVCEDAKEYFMFSVDCRARLDPPLPTAYWGNCIGGVVVKSDRKQLLGENGIAIATKAIGKGIMNADTEVWSLMEKGFSYYTSIPPGQFDTVSGSNKFGIYEIDFGWGNPKKNEANLTDFGGAIYLTDSPNEEGAVEIALVRHAVEMDEFASIFAKTLKVLDS
ncbi:hypothetical protein AQUCO_02600329v1 [Aquilegia coerulea]|uniref:Uncharacterized protein n=1 Tax=Aquilegia coerulea TaxID=218851 RepID=A0A2G5D8D1_AQUCA|nr:hypothetical protein AQUCO_02600329v1 [Aquilegia coerulea]